MKADIKTFYAIAALIIFVGLPIAFFTLGDFPRRSVLKEAISLLTLLAFTLMIGQFNLARSNMEVIQLYDLRSIQKLHKFIAYSAVTIILLHPLLIVLPRFFEGGINPWSALITMLTAFGNPGIVMGLIAWVLLLILTLTAIYRMELIKKFHIPYRNWRYFHGFLSVAFVTLGIIHAVKLGRHTNTLMAGLMIVLALIGVVMLFRLYLNPVPKPVQPPKTAGAN